MQCIEHITKNIKVKGFFDSDDSEDSDRRKKSDSAGQKLSKSEKSL